MTEQIEQRQYRSEMKRMQRVALVTKSVRMNNNCEESSTRKRKDKVESGSRSDSGNKMNNCLLMFNSLCLARCLRATVYVYVYQWH